MLSFLIRFQPGELCSAAPDLPASRYAYHNMGNSDSDVHEFKVCGEGIVSSLQQWEKASCSLNNIEGLRCSMCKRATKNKQSWRWRNTSL
jgi:hypothetical protein